ncbi:ABC transporter (plasmid) [Sinorhizobium sp. BG8]|nr:ABC transporter [Sinorhizobium sp. BG8]
MSRLLIVAVAVLSVAGLSACGSMGKAPPPVEQPAVYK